MTAAVHRVVLINVGATGGVRGKSVLRTRPWHAGLARSAWPGCIRVYAVGELLAQTCAPASALPLPACRWRRKACVYRVLVAQQQLQARRAGRGVAPLGAGMHLSVQARRRCRGPRDAPASLRRRRGPAEPRPAARPPLHNPHPVDAATWGCLTDSSAVMQPCQTAATWPYTGQRRPSCAHSSQRWGGSIYAWAGRE